MTGSILLLIALITIVGSYIVVKIAAIALMLTGMEEKKAAFQALSAFTGTGFTTREAESVVNYPSRRRIIMILMVLGRSSLVVVLASLLSSFFMAKGLNLLVYILALVVGIYVLYFLWSRSKLAGRWNFRLADRINRWKIMEEKTVEDILQVAPEYGIVEVRVKPSSGIVGKTLAQLALSHKGILVLTVRRSDVLIPAPSGNQGIQAGDLLLIYGHRVKIRERFSG